MRRISKAIIGVTVLVLAGAGVREGYKRSEGINYLITDPVNCYPYNFAQNPGDSKFVYGWLCQANRDMARVTIVNGKGETTVLDDKVNDKIKISPFPANIPDGEYKFVVDFSDKGKWESELCRIDPSRKRFVP